jgi:hypothetical protein
MQPLGEPALSQELLFEGAQLLIQQVVGLVDQADRSIS